MVVHSKRLPHLSALRVNVFLLAVLVCFLAIIGRGLYQISALKPAIEEKFASTYYHSYSLSEHRGAIYGAGDSAPLANNTDEYHVIVNPDKARIEFKGNAAAIRGAAEQVAHILDLPPDEVHERFQRNGRKWVSLKKNVPPYTIEALRRLGISALQVDYESARFYPNGELFAHVVGYIDHRGVGQIGMERKYQDELAPTRGTVRLLSTSRGAALEQLDYTPARGGNNVYLTISPRLQYFGYAALQEAVLHHQAKSASAIVMDVHNGQILSLLNYPSFNPNKIVDGNAAALRNRAVADVVEPGSIVKPFVVALAVEHNLVAPDEIFPTSKQPYRVGTLPVRDHVEEDLNAAGIIQRSSNIGAVLLAERAGKAALWEIYDRLNFPQASVLNIFEESGGVLRDYKKWRREDFATHAYGYGFSTTLLKMLQAYSVFATDGRMIHPTIESNVRAKIGARVFSAETARQMRLMMETVTQDGGTARRAAVPGFRVAGKTGTANKYVDGAYQTKLKRAFFIGMAPLEKPRYLVAVMVDEPLKNGKTGGVVAAPVFQKIMRRALLHGGIAPDAPLPEKSGGDV